MAGRYFLDTSAQIERHAGESSVRQRFREELDGAALATSTHVQREWKNIVDASATEILNACRGAEIVADVRARLRQGFGRKPSHHWLALDMICSDAGSVAEIELRTEQFLRVRTQALFTDRLSDVRDGSECMLAREVAHRDALTGKWTLRTMCKREECDCAQVSLTDREAERIEQAAEALANSSQSGHRKMARIARKAMAASDKTHRKGKVCWGANGLGGDISIALECAPNETVISTDQSFERIGPAIGVKHKVLPGTRTP